jgi:RNA polymerase sigma factor (sigma-70 family)
MAGGSPASLSRNLNSLFDAGTMTGLSDRDLMERFAGHRDGGVEAAFEVLVTRHGPMVLRVCRNVLANQDDADDAFQATFLVLVKERKSIRKLDSVASWLYGVAARVSARARVDAARRRRNETATIRLAAQSVEAASESEELEQALIGPVVQEEVRRLPEKYRSVVVLCFWEGLTQEQAAAQLGCPIGTVRSRMARARDLLRRRLARRGLASTAGALAAVMARSSSHAAQSLEPVSPDLIRSSVQAATRVAAGQATVEVVSANVAALVNRIAWSIALMKLRSLVTVLFVAGLFVFGAQAWAQRRREDGPRVRTVSPPPRTSTTTVDLGKKAQPGLVRLPHIIEPPDLLLVEVLEALPGRPISGERLVRPDGTVSLGFYGDVYVSGMTVPEAKEKIIQHLRTYLSDEGLGLLQQEETGPEEAPRLKLDKDGKARLISDLKLCDRVFVDVTAYNSRNYYVQGYFHEPGRLPFTGNETVLDAIQYAGGVLVTADTSRMRLIRHFPKGSPVQVLPINYEEITMGTDDSTNYQIMPDDRLVVPRLATPAGSQARAPAETASAAPASKMDGYKGIPTQYFPLAGNDTRSPVERQESSKLEQRMKDMEKKLDSILAKLSKLEPEAKPVRKPRPNEPEEEKTEPEPSRPSPR